jgi:hypothetical protein
MLNAPIRSPWQVDTTFRSSQHTISNAGLVGGGINPRRREVSLGINVKSFSVLNWEVDITSLFPSMRRRIASLVGKSDTPWLHPLYLSPQIPIQHAVVDRFQNVVGIHPLQTFQVGERTCNFKDAVMSSGGKVHLPHHVFQKAAALTI